MGVFALQAEPFRAWAIAAAHDLDLFAALPASVDELARGRHRMRALVAALVEARVLARDGDRITAIDIPSRPEVSTEGWGRLAEVIRADRPLALDDPHGYHQHLIRAGADAARELAPKLAATSLLDLGGGGGTYTAAFLDAHPGSRATLVDAPEVIAIARDHLARFGDRVHLVAGDARSAVTGEYGAVLLANVLHLHGASTSAELCAAAARAAEPGGVVAIADLDAGSPEGVWFALNMALYTDHGDVHATSAVRGWLAAAGLIELAEHRLASAPEVIVVTGRKPRGSGRRYAAATGLAVEAAAVGSELDAALARIGTDLALPAPLALELAHAIALERREGNAARIADMLRHYTAVMPAQRVAQLADPDALLREPLAWDRLPRLCRAIDRLYAVLADAGVDGTAALGAPTAEAFRARTPTLAVLYARTHYGGAMPLLYGNPDDLAYFTRHGGADLNAAIDRYLTTPIVHELCHLAPTRDALHPLHLDECIAGWLGVYVHSELAYPEVGHDDAIFAAPWLSQIGQAFARAFGIRPLVRAHAGAEPWDAALPATLVDAAARLGWDDWRARRTLHFLSDTMDPAPWVALALVAGAGRSLAGATLAELGATPLVDLAGELPADPAFDRAIVEDALRAMCLDNARIEGSLRARTSLPATPIAIDPRACTVIGVKRGDVDPVAPRYWLPPAVGARILATGATTYTLRLRELAAIPAAAAAIDAATPGVHSGFELVAE